MLISSKTKISTLIKANPGAVEAIASISKHFEKLRNPLLRKILAPRVTIADAARMGNTTVDVFFEKLGPLGFTIELTNQPDMPTLSARQPLPQFLEKLPASQLLELDVRLDILSGNDPFHKIMEAVQRIPYGGALCIINTFEPTPLIAILKKRGLSFYTEPLGPDLVHTYFFRENTREHAADEMAVPVTESSPKDFSDKVTAFAGKLRETDVRQLEMPLPMVTILSELENLPVGHALFVHHKRIPQMLLPQLEERGFATEIKPESEGQVKLLIYHKQ